MKLARMKSARLIAFPVVLTDLELKPLLEGRPLSSTVDAPLRLVAYIQQIHIHLHFHSKN